MLRIPQLILLWPVADFADNAHNAQFGLVMILFKKQLRFFHWKLAVFVAWPLPKR